MFYSVKIKRLLWGSVLLLAGCTPDLIGPQYAEDADVFSHSSSRIFVVNEGNFGWGNASISVYDPQRKAVQQRLFASKNGTPAGDVAQRMREIGGDYYLVMNNSNKILQIDTSTFSVKTEIPGLSSPRDICGCGDYFFVSLLYSSQLTVLDRNTLQPQPSITLGSAAEQLYSLGNHLFVTRPAGAVEVIDCETLERDTIFSTGSSPGRFVADKACNLWTTLSGSWNAPAALLRLDPEQQQVSGLFLTGTPTAKNLSLSADSTGGWFYGGDGIYFFSFSEEAVSETAIVETGSAEVYGFGCDPHTGDLYYSDALDFVQQSMIYRYSETGTPIDTFKAGIMSNGFVFE